MSDITDRIAELEKTVAVLDTRSKEEFKRVCEQYEYIVKQLAEINKAIKENSKVMNHIKDSYLKKSDFWKVIGLVVGTFLGSQGLMWWFH
ncbi:MAG: hypothetical protein ACTSUO_00115 [Candidatus Thorarchaeota archaeon]